MTPTVTRNVGSRRRHAPDGVPMPGFPSSPHPLLPRGEKGALDRAAAAPVPAFQGLQRAKDVS